MEARRWLERVRHPWWIAGGWVVDLHLGRQTRPHADLDVGCFRGDLDPLRQDMGDWQFYAAFHGNLRLLTPEEPPPAQANGIWCHPAGADEWWLELLLDEREGTDWVFRRCERVRRPTSDLTLVDPHGTRYLRPEIQLLYKAKAAREKDMADLEVLLPALGPLERDWLVSALATWEPQHAWLPELRRAV